MSARWITLWLLFAFFTLQTGQQSVGPPPQLRPLPPPGIAVPAAERTELEAALAALGREIDALRTTLKDKPELSDLLPDVEIYHKAVRFALVYNEFFHEREIPVARELLKQGLERARLLAEGKAPWTSQTGLVVRGYRSKIDGSVQPYGLVVPSSYRVDTETPRRLDLWLHGRHETLSEVNFINERQQKAGEFTPPGAFVLHPYGRYCNANKFAGEVDTFEALAHARRHYPIDENRLVVRGFSMGGAACWHLAAHHAGLWAAAAPGAGFAETAEYLNIFRTEPAPPPWYEQRLWHLYNSTDYAANLFNCPVVAYSGEIDRQKQAAEIMARALRDEGIELAHIIGPNTNHSYHPDSKKEINRRIDSIAAAGRNPVPRRVRFTTFTLRYNRMLWATIDALETHWERARVDAEITNATTVEVKTANVEALTLSMPAGLCPLDPSRRPVVIIDGQRLEAPAVLSDRSWTARFHKRAGSWETGANDPDQAALRKSHGLQGPIDDAFMDSFLVVRPTGRAMHEGVGSWVASEQRRALTEWRKQFRGEARIKDDTAITDEDIAAHNLILWGDPQSNRVMARVMEKMSEKLPLRWDAKEVRLGGQVFAADRHVPVLIYPNPLNPQRYVVFNSGFTFREYHYSSNARQTPKLPDYAIVDLSIPPSPRDPGRIVAAGFFGERWELKPASTSK